jgi:hypothetical protein
VRSEKKDKPLVTAEEMAQAIGARAHLGDKYLTGFAKVMLEAQFNAGLEAAEKVVWNYLLHSTQRAVSWHEVNDAIKAIREMKQKGKP